MSKVIIITWWFLSLIIDTVLCEKVSKPSSDHRTSIKLLRDDKTLAVIEKNDHNQILNCVLYDLEKDITALEVSTRKYSKPVEPCKFDIMMAVIDECEKLSTKVSPQTRQARNSDDLELTFNSTDISSLWRGIIPGTKWCGLGDEAAHYHDLGLNSEVDRCCRAHDHCPVRMKPFRSEYGLINLSIYTRSHCNCDKVFYECLRILRSPLADLIGNFYFNIMQIGCLDDSTKDDSCSSPFGEIFCNESVPFYSKRSKRRVIVTNKLRY